MLRIPNFVMPPLMSNHGNYIVSLGKLVRWLGEQAAELGVEIYPGFAAAEVLNDEEGAVAGVATGDMGVGKRRQAEGPFQRGMELRGKYTLFAEGARGSLSKQLITHVRPRRRRRAAEVRHRPQGAVGGGAGKHQPGLVQHTLGWPLDNRTGGGSFLYHYGDNLVSVGFVVHLNYENPYLSPFKEFQRFKTHPAIRDMFEGGKRIAYGARAHDRGRLAIDAEAGVSGRRAARLRGGLHERAAHQGHRTTPWCRASRPPRRRSRPSAEGRAHDTLEAYEDGGAQRADREGFAPVRNAKPLLVEFGTALGIGLGGLDMWLNTSLPGVGFGYTLEHSKPDYGALKASADCKPIDYPKPDGVLTFDRLTTCRSRHQPRGGPAGPPEVDRPARADRRQPAGLCRAGATLLPGRRLRGGWRTARQAALSDQRAELRPL